MGRPNEPVEEDASNLPGIDPHRGARHLAASVRGAIVDICYKFCRVPFFVGVE
jgi:hypothetical protein